MPDLAKRMGRFGYIKSFSASRVARPEKRMWLLLPLERSFVIQNEIEQSSHVQDACDCVERIPRLIGFPNDGLVTVATGAGGESRSCGASSRNEKHSSVMPTTTMEKQLW